MMAPRMSAGAQTRTHTANCGGNFDMWASACSAASLWAHWHTQVWPTSGWHQQAGARSTLIHTLTIQRRSRWETDAVRPKKGTITASAASCCMQGQQALVLQASHSDHIGASCGCSVPGWPSWSSPSSPSPSSAPSSSSSLSSPTSSSCSHTCRSRVQTTTALATDQHPPPTPADPQCRQPQQHRGSSTHTCLACPPHTAALSLGTAL